MVPLGCGSKSGLQVAILFVSEEVDDKPNQSFLVFFTASS
jgi:hypothetical protein